LPLDLDRLRSEPVGWTGFLRSSAAFFFIERNSDRTFIVLTLDAEILRSQVDAYLRDQLKNELNLVNAYEGAAALYGPGDEIMAMNSKSVPTSAPFVSVPIISQFGAWRIDAWRRIETRIEYNIPLLAAACALSAVLFLLGILAFVQQRSAIRLAEQRVSFVNRVSHELRSPLTNILLNGDLAAGAVEDRPGRAVQHLDLLREEARRLSRLIQNVLTFARSSRGKLKLSFETVNLDETIREVVAQFEPSLKRAEIQVELCEIPANSHVAADADAVRQILGNLIANVEKYAAEAGFLGIDIRESSDAQQLQILVADRGPGIPPSKSARIFEPFERLSSRVNEGVSGAGLGLAIGRELAERMNGRLDLETGEDGVGAVFVLTLPKSES
ncbi:MAG: HAMP domain-containing sensor histidine kinase, partial [Verrucomicrobiota bacterium]